MLGEEVTEEVVSQEELLEVITGGEVQRGTMLHEVVSQV